MTPDADKRDKKSNAISHCFMFPTFLREVITGKLGKGGSSSSPSRPWIRDCMSVFAELNVLEPSPRKVSSRSPLSLALGLGIHGW